MKIILNLLKSVYLLTFITFLVSCNVTYVIKQPNINEIIEDKIQNDDKFLSEDILLYVDIKSQSLFLLKKGQVLKKYIISSSKYGTGNKEGSLQTPLGIHYIKHKIGEDLPFGAILKGRAWSGDIADIITTPFDSEYDHVTSRILWLQGYEEGINKGPGIDSFDRFIYIHGTAEEGLIGQPASDGCIRMYNDDVIELFNIVVKNTQVLIY